MTLTEEAIAEQLVVGTGQDQAHRAEALRRRSAARSSASPSWSHGSEFDAVDFAAGHGEIVALMGVEGSGARELLRSFAGLERCSGAIRIDGVEGGGGLPPHGLCAGDAAAQPLLEFLGRREPRRAARRAADRRAAARAQEEADARARRGRDAALPGQDADADAEHPLALRRQPAEGGDRPGADAEPRLILLEEPTRGVDIESKREIYRLLREFAAGGNAVVMFCTEVLEIFEAADRVIVVSDGRLSASLQVRDFPHIEALAAAITRLERHTRLRLIEGEAAVASTVVPLSSFCGLGWHRASFEASLREAPQDEEGRFGSPG